MRKILMLATALAIVVAPAYAYACDIAKISGTWLITVQAEWDDVYAPVDPLEIRATCWLVISRPRNVGVHCQDDRLFGLSWAPDVTPWHQIERASTASTETVSERRFKVPNRCQWRLFDRNDLDIEYTLNFAPDMNTLLGSGEGYADKHYGSTEPFTAFFAGIRQ